ncbi:hypothetical protein KCTC52924_02769 [Arenibacter antarcticus]|uniref:DUF6503 family protein n=1 Tax=Arenibacter antarcticus TaxID=2040469 RepID=A0ABW5VG91_9FLAO|nr:DUF6503 family protein [Arenibacter sp. H213]MCM4167189.1 hypothetical protein [Arenibacter sp. H213]
MKINLFAIILSLSLVSCGSNDKKQSQNEAAPEFQNKGHQLVYDMAQKVGNYSKLMGKKDVVYTYTYETPDGKKDVVTEKYLFKGELSYGAYHTHERTLPQLQGLIEQGFDGSEFWLKHNGKILNDENLLKGVVFNRPTNFYWFAMMQKLLDKGLKYEYLGDKKIEGIEYDIVKVTFDIAGKKTSDTYQLYINKETALVDQFLFTVADFDVIENPYLMKLEYESIDGLLLPTKRKYKISTWNAEVTNEPWIKVTWSNIKFRNSLAKEDFKK